MIQHTNPGSLIAPATGFTATVALDHTTFDKVIYVSGIVSQNILGETVGINDPEAQFEQIWLNIASLLAPNNADLSHIVATTTYITGREYLPALEKIRKEQLGGAPPTSAVVIVAGLPNPYHIASISVIAVVNSEISIHHTHPNEFVTNQGGGAGHTHTVQNIHKHAGATVPAFTVDATAIHPHP